jgi:hypothetical protein
MLAGLQRGAFRVASAMIPTVRSVVGPPLDAMAVSHRGAVSFCVHWHAAPGSLFLGSFRVFCALLAVVPVLRSR